MEIKILSIFLWLVITFLPVAFALGAFFMDRHYKRALSDIQCQNCKHFKECKGFWRIQNKETGYCKIYSKNDRCEVIKNDKK